MAKNLHKKESESEEKSREGNLREIHMYVCMYKNTISNAVLRLHASSTYIGIRFLETYIK